MSTYRYVKKNTLFLFVNVLTQLLKLLSFIRYEYQPSLVGKSTYMNRRLDNPEFPIPLKIM